MLDVCVLVSRTMRSWSVMAVVHLYMKVCNVTLVNAVKTRR